LRCRPTPDYIRKGRRADAAAFLADIVARQQQFLLDRRAYATVSPECAVTGGLGLDDSGERRGPLLVGFHRHHFTSAEARH